MATDYQALLQKAYLTPEQLASPLTRRDPIRTERTAFGEYGIYNDAPILNAARAEQLAQPGEVFSDFSHSRGNYTKDLGWSSNSFSGKLARGAAAFGVKAVPLNFQQDSESGAYPGLLGTPQEPMGYDFIGLDDVAKRFGLDRSQFTPYEKEVEGERITDSESMTRAKGVLVRGDSESGIPDRPLTRTVTAEEQMYEKLNELSKDYFLYTGDTTIPGQGSEGGGQSFQTALYQKQGDKLIALAPPQAHGGWQNADVYTGGGGFKLSELLRGIAPVAAFAIGAPFLDAALFGASAGAAAAGGGASTGAGTGLLSGYTGATKGLLLPEMIAGTAGSLSGAGSAAGIAGTQAAAGLGIVGGSALPAAGMAVGALPSTVGQFSAALPAQGSLSGTSVGLASKLAPGTILGSGLPGGGAIGASYALGANGMPALNLLGQPIPASSIGIGNIPQTVTSGLSIGIKDALDVARIGRGLLGGQQQQPQQQAAMQRPQSIMPQGQVDYSGILNLLQVPSPQRNMYSLLG
jgi:hypothetical protein